MILFNQQTWKTNCSIRSHFSTQKTIEKKKISNLKNILKACCYFYQLTKKHAIKFFKNIDQENRQAKISNEKKIQFQKIVFFFKCTKIVSQSQYVLKI